MSYNNFFDGYEEFTKNRIEKIESLFGKNWFAGKRVLELACGHGEIGKHLYSLGAHVTFADARKEFIDKIIEENPNFINANYAVLNQDKKWILDEKYDLIIHFGVLYHLENWKQDIATSLEHTDLLLLESIVNPVGGITEEKMISNDNFQNSFNGIDSYFSEESVEFELRLNNVRYLKINDSKLNTNWTWDYDVPVRHIYDWEIENIGFSPGKKTFHRRMWLILK
jgi:SAM-dependent methyltransferase